MYKARKNRQENGNFFQKWHILFNPNIESLFFATDNFKILLQIKHKNRFKI